MEDSSRWQKVTKYIKTTYASNKGAFHSFIMLFSFITLLGMIIAETQKFRYISSTLAISNSLGITGSELEAVNSIEDFWSWLKRIESNLGGETASDVDANCKSFTDPTQSGSCSGLDYIEDAGEERPVFIAGNNHAMSIGMFTERSAPQIASRDSSKLDFTVRSDVAIGLNANHDEKVIEICEVQWGICVLEDAFKNKAGSSLQWDGLVLDGKLAFVEGSSATRYLFDGDLQQGKFDSLVPCYAYNESTMTLIPGNSSYQESAADITPSNCEYHWIVPGSQVRTMCLETFESSGDDDESTGGALDEGTLLSFMSSYYNYDSVSHMMNEYFACDTLIINTSHTELKTVFVENSLTLRIYLNTIGMYGNFFETSNEYEWLGEAVHVRKILQMMDLVDKNTRTIVLFFISRNLGPNALFYTMTTVEFRLMTSGKVTHSVTSTYVPIIQYYYGIDGYPWLIRSAAVFEAIFLFLFAIMFVRETRQLIYRLHRFCFPKVSPEALHPALFHPVPPKESVHQVTHSEETPPLSNVMQYDEECGKRDETIPEDDRANALRKSSSADMYVLGDIAEEKTSVHEEEEEKSVEAKRPYVESQWSRKIRERIESRRKSIFALFESQDISHTFEFIPDERAIYDPLDWLTIAVVITGIYFRVAMILGARDIHMYMLSRPGGHYDGYIQKILQRFTRLDEVAFDLAVVYFAIVFIGFLQFFRYVGFSKQMAIVTETILNSARQLAPVLLIFSVVLTGYAVLGCEIYGHVLSEWATVGEAVTTLFVLILGDNSSYYRMKSVSPIQTAVFFWSFAVVVLFVLFNMVLAVIFTIYEEKQAEINAYYLKRDDQAQKKD